MLYNSTQDKKNVVNSAKAIATGISKDGGLFVPQEFPKLDLKELLGLSYNERANAVLSRYLTDFSEVEVMDCVDKAYTAEKFVNENPVPIVEKKYNGNPINFLELWHGPTSAFKDMALQILPHILTKSFEKEERGKKAVILVATSGDTGKAALEGFRDVENTKIIVFYPENGVSEIQKFQMNSQEGKNVKVCGINGNFDDAQTAVKHIFTNPEMAQKLSNLNMMFSSANSINWGRLVPQIVYYVSAYCDMVDSGKMALGDKINIVVPTGNFGNILAAYYAMQMGVHVNKFICASNTNNVLTDFLNTAVYNKNRDFVPTISPSMDILVSSNLERLLYHLSGNDDKAVREWIFSLKGIGSFSCGKEMQDKLKELFFADFCNEDETKQTIRKLFEQEKYLCDPHTAVAVNVYDKYVASSGDRATPTLLASTASPYKFPSAVVEALVSVRESSDDEFKTLDLLQSISETKIPAPISGLKTKNLRFKNTVEVSNMERFVLDSLGLN